MTPVLSKSIVISLLTHATTVLINLFYQKEIGWNERFAVTRDSNKSLQGDPLPPISQVAKAKVREDGNQSMCFRRFTLQLVTLVRDGLKTLLNRNILGNSSHPSSLLWKARRRALDVAMPIHQLKQLNIQRRVSIF